ncbi:Rieske 2Fe-2S domain-containing protein [Deltaproteobacteria bacterium TL4]
MALHKIGEESEIPVGGKKVFKVNDETILVFHLDDGFYAVQNRCTHVFAPLDKGKLVDGCKIQCPFHRAQFDVKTGEVIAWANFPPGIQLLNVIRKEKTLKTYQITVQEGELFADVE